VTGLKAPNVPGAVDQVQRVERLCAEAAGFRCDEGAAPSQYLAQVLSKKKLHHEVGATISRHAAGIHLASVLRQARYGEVFPALPRSILGEQAPAVAAPVARPSPVAQPASEPDDLAADDETPHHHDARGGHERVLH
jgi:hypothetical protein